MKSRVKNSLILCFIVVFFASFMLSTVTETALAANSYVINGKTVTCNTIAHQGAGGCWDYAQKMYQYIWGTSFSSYRGTNDDMLRNMSKSDLTLTVDHIRAYVSQAAPGSVIRISNSELFGSYDGGVYHSMIIVAKDANGLTVFENWNSGVYEHYYTWSDFCRGTYASNFNANDAYIKYIKWPGAPEYSGGSVVSNWATITAGEYNIVNADSGLYLDVANAGDENGTNVQTIANNGNSAQRWTISGNANGYRIDAGNSKTGKVLNMWGQNIVSGNNVTIYENTGHNSQRWVFEKLSNGNYIIRMQGNTNCVLDVNERNAYICTYSSGKKSQQWKLVSTCTTHSYTDGFCTKCGVMLAYKNYNASCETGTYDAITDTSLREKAYDKSTVLASIPKGAKVTVKSAVINGYDNRWYLATYNGVEGYIYETKVQKEHTHSWGTGVSAGIEIEGNNKVETIVYTCSCGEVKIEKKIVGTAGPTINTQPANKTVVVGNTASFAIAATGSGLTYQWQAYNPNTGNWTNSSAASAKTATLTITTQSAHNGFKFRCVVKDGNGNSVTSNAATLTINPKFTAQPQAASVTAGSTATFSVTAAGASPLSYQWQAYNPSTGNWVNSGAASAKMAKLSITAQTGHNGFKFRCVVTDANGTKITSNAATLAVTAAAPKITKQPEAATVKSGASVSFSVTATGTGLKYQWQAYNPNTGKWTNSSAASAKTSKLTITAQNAHNGFKFRCVVTDANSKTVTSSAVTLTVIQVVELKITKQPAALTVKAGATASFAVTATGTGLTYQWQAYNPNTEKWTNSSAASSKTAKLSITAQNAHNGFKFRCVVKDSTGKSVTSTAATLTVLAQTTTTLTITSQPASVSAANGTSCKFTVVAKGQGTLTYQWQYKATGSSTWANSTAASATTDTLRSTVKTSMSGYQFRCVVKDSAGNQVISNAATMTAK